MGGGGQKRLPEVEDCRATMQRNLPPAYELAIKQVGECLQFFQAALRSSQTATSMADFYRDLGKSRARFLEGTWHMAVDPRFRALKGIPKELSRAEIQQQFTEPLKRIVDTYQKILRALERSGFTVECEYKDNIWYEGCGGGDEGWVGTLFGVPVTDVHICVDDIDQTNVQKIAEVIVHEVSHKFAATHDNLRDPSRCAHYFDKIEGVPAPYDRSRPGSGAGPEQRDECGPDYYRWDPATGRSADMSEERDRALELAREAAGLSAVGASSVESRTAPRPANVEEPSRTSFRSAAADRRGSVEGVESVLDRLAAELKRDFPASGAGAAEARALERSAERLLRSARTGTEALIGQEQSEGSSRGSEGYEELLALARSLADTAAPESSPLKGATSQGVGGSGPSDTGDEALGSFGSADATATALLTVGRALAEEAAGTASSHGGLGNEPPPGASLLDRARLLALEGAGEARTGASLGAGPTPCASASELGRRAAEEVVTPQVWAGVRDEALTMAVGLARDVAELAEARLGEVHQPGGASGAAGSVEREQVAQAALGAALRAADEYDWGAPGLAARAAAERAAQAEAQQTLDAIQDHSNWERYAQGFASEIGDAAPPQATGAGIGDLLPDIGRQAGYEAPILPPREEAVADVAQRVATERAFGAASMSVLPHLQNAMHGGLQVMQGAAMEAAMERLSRPVVPEPPDASSGFGQSFGFDPPPTGFG